jgi:deferrochelatase/peroxidase EfeB
MLPNLEDVQGLIVRGYGMPSVSHLSFRVRTRGTARRRIGALVDGPDGPDLRVTGGAEWPAGRKPEACLNVGFTAEGLRALGLPENSLRTFPPDFAEGADRRVGRLLQRSLNGLDPGAHLLVTIHARSDQIRGAAARRIRGRLGEGDAFECVGERVGNQLAGEAMHFGFRDGISQPNVAGFPSGKGEALPTGQFLLGYPSQWSDYTYPVPQPEELGHSGSFAAYIVIEQDNVAFEAFLDESAAATGLPRERIAAKLCGRWANGSPLVQAPAAPSPADLGKWDDFTYAEDAAGLRCPWGAHIRRANPRNDRNVRGIRTQNRRILRRGLPYGRAFDPEHPHDGVERGLLGYFIMASLADQFEFVLKEWMSGGSFSGRLRANAVDPFFPFADDLPYTFSAPSAEDPALTLKPGRPFVRCRELMYLFLPSLTALRYLSRMPGA